jgi:hypothetical protein
VPPSFAANRSDSTNCVRTAAVRGDQATAGPCRLRLAETVLALPRATAATHKTRNPSVIGRGFGCCVHDVLHRGAAGLRGGATTRGQLRSCRLRRGWRSARHSALPACRSRHSGRRCQVDAALAEDAGNEPQRPLCSRHTVPIEAKVA